MKTSRHFPLAAAAMLVCGLGLLLAQQGPSRDVETVAKPRKKETPAETTGEKVPSKFSKKAASDNLPEVPTYRSDAITVQLDVAVLSDRGVFLPGIPQDRFRILEDDVPQKITSFTMGEAPVTVALVVEWSARFQAYWSETWYQTLTAAHGFLETLRQDDYAAVVAYDIRPQILTDFTQNRREILDAMRALNTPAYSEANLFDTVTDTADRMSDIEGRKAIVLISSGMDTLSRITFGEARRSLQTSGVPIYSIGLMQALRTYYEHQMGAIARLDFLQADNQLRTFSQETGGQSFFPRFYGEFPSIFAAISESLRNQYSLAYTPSNQTRDGKYRRIKVELIDPETGKQLRVEDENKRAIKYRIVTRAGYNAPREVE